MVVDPHACPLRPVRGCDDLSNRGAPSGLDGSRRSEGAFGPCRGSSSWWSSSHDRVSDCCRPPPSGPSHPRGAEQGDSEAQTRRGRGTSRGYYLLGMVGPKNTPLACRLAVEYERMSGEPFPGGPTNAYIQRTHAGYWQRAEGYPSWNLMPIDSSYGWPMVFGSQWPATEAVKQPDKCLFVDRNR